MKKIHIIILFFYLILFAALAMTALSYSYVEGDDASTILYHLLGRDVEKQMYYSAYHSGFDKLLSILPIDEPILRKTAITISFVFGFLVTYLSYYWVSRYYVQEIKLSLTFGLLLPFIIPELLFQSLLYNPTNVGFTFCLLGLIGFENFFADRNKKWLIIIPLLFMIGVPFRWSLLIFLLVPVGIYLMRFQVKVKDFIKDWTFLILLLSSLVASFIGIYLTGFNISDFISVVVWGENYMDSAEKSLLGFLSPGFSLFTPAMVVLLLYGFIRSFQESQKVWILLLFSVLPFFVLGFSLSLKYLITLLPAVLLLMVTGMKYLINKRFLLISFIVIILVPWILSLQIGTNKYAWGPGYEAENWKNQNAETIISKNPDQRLGWHNVSISFSKGGFAMPTLEGPRPVYGYFQTLFGGQQKGLINSLEDERIGLIKMVIKENVPLVQDRRVAYNQTLLFRAGYASFSNFVKRDSIYSRIFTKQTDTVEILVSVKSQDNQFLEFWSRNLNQPFGIYSSYSHIITNCTSNNNFSRLGPFTGFYKNQ